jgi:hypothetical protein
MGKAAQPSAQSSGRKDVSMQQAERIGAMLKRARESRGLTIEALSKELKLNPRYIQALEVDDYDLLPGDTYIRVYLRSVCVFLALNPDDILKRFFDERGLSGVDTLRRAADAGIVYRIGAHRDGCHLCFLRQQPGVVQHSARQCGRRRSNTADRDRPGYRG